MYFETKHRAMAVRPNQLATTGRGSLASHPPSTSHPYGALTLGGVSRFAVDPHRDPARALIALLQRTQPPGN